MPSDVAADYDPDPLRLHSFTNRGLPDTGALTILMPMTTRTGTNHQKNRQLKALMLLVVACCVMLICLTQRASVLQQMQVKAAAIVQVANGGQEIAPDALSPCQLSAHSLLCAQPLHFDTVLLLPGLLMLLLAALVIVPVRIKPDAVPRPPLLRIHLKNCVFRE
ncbi:copper-binding protein [Siccibacter colletis]|uniref:copper-binding protein n=1 Tax=Siccibacter colletis TaxID=1505757 RepID=UPI003CED7474